MKAGSAVTKCRECGAKISFIKTPAGNFMPVNADAFYFVFDKDGPDVIVNIHGEVVKGRKIKNNENMGNLTVSVGHTPHWATCTKAAACRKAKKAKAEKAPAPPAQLSLDDYMGTTK